VIVMISPSENPALPVDRRARRRQETIEEILDLAEEVMNEDGVGGLSLSEVARRLGVKPPSIYKYFGSLLDIYDALFARGHLAHLEHVRTAISDADPGIPVVKALLEASGQWCMAHPAIAQLLFWRPVPGYEPSPEALAPSIEMVAIQQRAFADAVAAGQLAAQTDPDELTLMAGVVMSGALGMSLANDPGVPWGEGRFSALLVPLLDALVGAHQASASPTP
jgi:AcrR family transcriptional regulator